MRKHGVGNILTNIIFGAALIVGGCASGADSDMTTNEVVVYEPESESGLAAPETTQEDAASGQTLEEESALSGETTLFENINIDISGKTETTVSSDNDPADEQGEAIEEGWKVNYSMAGGYLYGSQSVALTAAGTSPEGAQIYYTLNGNDPDKSGVLYTGDIALANDSPMNVYALKAVVKSGEEYGEVYEQTYVLFPDESYLPDIDIVFLTSDEYNLYDYYYGILVDGYTYDQSLEDEAEHPYKVGNYSNEGPEWIRNTHITMIDTSGEVLISQNVGMAVAGNTSRTYDFKSFTLTAGEEYDAANPDITFTAYESVVSGVPYNFVTELKKIRLRAGSQDTFEGNIRSAVVSRLSTLMGFEGCTDTHRAVVFLNNKFYGIFDIQQNYTDGFIARKYGLPSSECVEIMKGGEDQNWDDTLKLRKVFMADMSVAANREAMEALVDIDDFFNYYILNLFCNNVDWPQNNYCMWRYTGEYIEGNKYTDGRWRFLEYDTDVIFQSENSPNHFEGSDGDAFEYMLTNSYFRCASFFDEVISSDYYRGRFLARLCDLFNTAFSEESLGAVIDGEAAVIRESFSRFYWDVMAADWELLVSDLREQALERQGEMEALLGKYLGVDVGDTFTVNVVAGEGVTLKINSTYVYPGQSYSCDYYRDATVSIEALASPGFTLDALLFNGQAVEPGVLVLGKGGIEGDAFEISAATTRQAVALIFTQVYSYKKGDYMVIKNVGSEAVNLKDYYLSDNESKLKKTNLADYKLSPGKSIVVYGKDNPVTDVWFRCTFNIGMDETLFIADAQGNILDKVYVGRIGEYEYYARVSDGAVWGYTRID
ncbi:MAG: CotH kinase family protein [Lachnospiraceae bacterium]|nr:CotH kinase family protein [Lachnospiraceae bacterium]